MNEDEQAAGLAPTPGYRYAQVIGSELIVAGQVPLDSTGNLVGAGSPTLQTSQALDNLATLLGVHGFDRTDIRHLTIYVVGPHHHLIQAWEAMTNWWDGTVPPATLLGVAALGYDEQLVEIDARIIRAPRSSADDELVG